MGTPSNYPTYYNQDPRIRTTTFRGIHFDWNRCTNCTAFNTRNSAITRSAGVVVFGIDHRIFIPEPHLIQEAWEFISASKYSAGKTFDLSASTSTTLPKQVPHLLIIGEAPGESEDVSGQLFFGKSGNQWNRIIQLTKLNFTYILTNRLCCRPTHTTETATKLSKLGTNRPPSPQEMTSCEPHINHLVQEYSFDGLILLGEKAHTYKSKLPRLELVHPSFILRQDYPLYACKKMRDKLRNFINSLKLK